MKTTCAKTAKTVTYIHSKTIVKDREYPWTGAFYSNGEFRCGGSLSKFFFKEISDLCVSLIQKVKTKLNI